MPPPPSAAWELQLSERDLAFPDFSTEFALFFPVAAPVDGLRASLRAALAALEALPPNPDGTPAAAPSPRTHETRPRARRAGLTTMVLFRGPIRVSSRVTMESRALINRVLHENSEQSVLHEEDVDRNGSIVSGEGSSHSRVNRFS